MNINIPCHSTFISWGEPCNGHNVEDESYLGVPFGTGYILLGLSRSDQEKVYITLLLFVIIVICSKQCNDTLEWKNSLVQVMSMTSNFTEK